MEPRLTPLLELPCTHPSQRRFGAYQRVENYVRHMNNQFVSSMTISSKYDSVINQTENFKQSFPKPTTQFQPSFYPNSQLSSELESKLGQIIAYQNLEMERPSTSKTNRPASSLPFKKRETDKEVLGHQYYGYVERLDHKFRKVSVNKIDKSDIVQKKLVKKNLLYSSFRTSPVKTRKKTCFRTDRIGTLAIKTEETPKLTPLYKRVFKISRGVNHSPAFQVTPAVLKERLSKRVKK